FTSLQVESASSPMQVDSHHIGVETCTIGVSTEPDCLGPCEPGTSVNLEGIVWHETENGKYCLNQSELLIPLLSCQIVWL
ncbi:hypothetical protein LOTGIDRAFT_118373, partial [Lottia gigantea]